MNRTMASQHSDLIPVIVRVYDDPNFFSNFAEGGFAKASQHAQADRVRKMGRYDDTMLVHLNPIEFEQLKKQWGEPTINPETGLPEYGWFSKALSFVLPAAASLILGPIAGSAIGSLTGLGSGLASSALGSALVGGGISGLTGGNPLVGAVTGGLGSVLGPALGITGEGGALSKLGESFGITGNDGLLSKIGLTGEGGVLSGLTGPSGGTSPSTQASSLSSYPSADVPTPTARPGEFGMTAGNPSNVGAAGSGISLSKLAIPALLGAAMLGGGSKPQVATATAPTPTDPNMTRHLSGSGPTRSVADMSADPYSYYTYGSRPEQSFYSGNAPTFPVVTAAHGGSISNSPLQSLSSNKSKYIQGPGDGRADEIPARLSNNEYVMDAETVSMLGNGSPDAGAKKLDEFRSNLRKHKGKSLAKGKFSPDAKSPMQYLAGGRA